MKYKLPCFRSTLSDTCRTAYLSDASWTETAAFCAVTLCVLDGADGSCSLTCLEGTRWREVDNRMLSVYS